MPVVHVLGPSSALEPATRDVMSSLVPSLLDCSQRAEMSALVVHITRGSALHAFHGSPDIADHTIYVTHMADHTMYVTQYGRPYDIYHPIYMLGWQCI